MKKDSKIKLIILVSICVIALIVLIILNIKDQKQYLIEIKYDKLMEKINNKEDFVLLLSQTTCEHCMDFKPKLNKVSKKYKLYTYYIEVNLLNDEERQGLKNIISYDGTPTTVFIFNGTEKTVANRLDGSVSEEKIIAKLKSNGFIE